MSQRDRKIRILIGEDVSDLTAISAVQTVIGRGRISNSPHGEQYCHGTTFEGGYICACWRTRAADNFRVYKEKDR